MTFGYDVADTLRRTAATGVLLPIFYIETVVKRELFTGCDVAPCGDPDMAAHVLTLAVGITGVVNEPRGIPRHVAIEIGAFVDLENVDTAIASSSFASSTRGVAAFGFSFGDAFALILDDAGARGNITAGANPAPVNG